MSPRLELEGIGKRYRRSGRRDALRDLIPALAGRALGRRSDDEDEFWAVRDLSFSVGPGQALGIIGPNGSGKSTALKIVSGIVHPTVGQRRVEGRLGALLELGAAFHPDLTGRENVRLQGSLLGLDAAAVRARFDEIIDFSGVEAFLDTPLKYYSSGMQARLGFSVAAHLEPELLVIDEVLSVGDWAFQQKAYARVRHLVRSGLPCVLVTHQLDRVMDLCTRTLLLRDGVVAFDGAPSAAVEAYLAGETPQIDDADADAPLRLGRLEIAPSEVGPSETVRFSVGLEMLAPMADAWGLQLRVRALQSGAVVYAAFADELGLAPLVPGAATVHGTLRAHLTDGLYQIELAQIERSTGGAASGMARGTFRVVGKPSVYGPAELGVVLQVG